MKHKEKDRTVPDGVPDTDRYRDADGLEAEIGHAFQII